MPKPTITSPCVAERQNHRKWSRIAEFSGHAGGGLVEIQDWTIDGVAFTRVDLHGMDSDVRVRLDPRHLDLTPNQRDALRQLNTPTRFTVRGRGLFPLDMLRRDCCWPATEVDSNNIQLVMEREIGLLSTKGWLKLTRKRWESFGWVIVETDQELAGQEEAAQ